MECWKWVESIDESVEEGRMDKMDGWIDCWGQSGQQKQALTRPVQSRPVQSSPAPSSPSRPGGEQQGLPASPR